MSEPKQLTSVMIANALDSPAAHTSFGKLPLSVEKSSAAYGFGSGTRDQLNKLYMSKELNSESSKMSPGPKYDIHDNPNFKNSPQFSVSKEERVTLGKPQYYDHYSIKDVFTDSIKAKNFTKNTSPNAKFGTESRMPPPLLEGTPGPQYFPKVKKVNPPSYSLGARRNKNPLMAITGSPRLVGPGRYLPELGADPSHLNTPSKWTFGRESRFPRLKAGVARNQTYDMRSRSCGVQINSKKRTMPEVKFKTSTREQINKLGMFSDMMSTKPTSVRIPLPKF